MFTLTVKGEQRFMAALAGLERQVRDQRPAFEAVIDRELMPDIAEQFDTEGRGRWPEVTAGTLARKRRLYGDKPTLQASGAEVKSLTQERAKHQIRNVRPDAAEFGTDLQYAAIHQNPEPDSDLPERALVISDQLRGRILDRVTEVNAGEARGLGFEVIR